MTVHFQVTGSVVTHKILLPLKFRRPEHKADDLEHFRVAASAAAVSPADFRPFLPPPARPAYSSRPYPSSSASFAGFTSGSGCSTCLSSVARVAGDISPSSTRAIVLSSIPALFRRLEPLQVDTRSRDPVAGEGDREIHSFKQCAGVTQSSAVSGYPVGA